MTTALVPLQDIERMAASIASSGLFGVKTKEQAMGLMLLCQAEGLHPAIAARDYHIVNGRPALKADAMMARYMQSGGKVEWHQYDDTKVSATFSHPQGGSVKVEWTIEMAKRIGLAGKDVWKSYPRAMLRARVISEGVRTTNPGVAVGVYTPEEVADFTPRERDITPTAGYLTSLPAARQEVMHETAALIKEHWENDRVQDGYALIEDSKLNAEEMIALWSLLPSNIRSAHKRMKESERAADKGVISPAQHKRLEARIKERGINRDAVKDFCKTQYGVEHFTDLNKDDYKLLDAHLSAHSGGPLKAAPPQPQASPAPAGTLPAPGGAAPDVTQQSQRCKAVIAMINAAKGKSDMTTAQGEIEKLENDAEREFCVEHWNWRVKELKAAAASAPKQTRKEAEQAVADMASDLPFKPTQGVL